MNIAKWGIVMVENPDVVRFHKHHVALLVFQDTLQHSCGIVLADDSQSYLLHLLNCIFCSLVMIESFFNKCLLLKHLVCTWHSLSKYKSIGAAQTLC